MFTPMNRAWNLDEFRPYLVELFTFYRPSNLTPNLYNDVAEAFFEAIVGRGNTVVTTVRELMWFIPDEEKSDIIQQINSDLA